MEDVKPCPFCGKESKIYGSYWPPEGEGGHFWIQCKGCEIRTRTYTFKLDLIKYWNERPE